MVTSSHCVLIHVKLVRVPLADHLSETLHEVKLHDAVVFALVLETIDHALEFGVVILHKNLLLLGGEHPVLFAALHDELEADELVPCLLLRLNVLQTLIHL